MSSNSTVSVNASEARLRRSAARRGLVVHKLRQSPTAGTDCVFVVSDVESGALLSSQWGMTLEHLVAWLDDH